MMKRFKEGCIVAPRCRLFTNWLIPAFLTFQFAWCVFPLQAQFGFVPSPTYDAAYGNAWGNYYAGTAAQLPAWNSTPINNNWPSENSWQGWQLGAVIQNTPSGVLIQQVVPGSIAQRSGLKQGDIIVSVGGAQVGYSNGRVVDLIYEINRRVDSNGQVRLTVLESTSRQLRTYSLNIAQRPAANFTVSGRLFVDSGALIYGSNTIKVELLNVTRPYMTASGGSTYVQAYGVGPFPFSISRNPSYVNVNDRYRLVATLYDANRQVVAYTTVDINSPASSSPVSYDLRLQSPQSGSPIFNSSYGYYYPEQNIIYDTFRQYLGRDPSASEAQAWQQQLALGMTPLSELKAEVIASPAFYDRVGNNPDQFIKLMIESTTKQQAPFDRVQYWRARLDSYGGDRLSLAREYVQSPS